MNPNEPKLRRLKVLAFVEGTSLLLLVVVAVPLKHAFGISAGVKAMGPLHGIAFLAYVVAVVDALGTRRLTRRHAALAILSAMIPGGSFVFARRVISGRDVSPASAGGSGARS